MEISLTTSRIKKISKGVRENRFRWAISSDATRILFTWDKSLIWISDFYPELEDFCLGFPSCEIPYEKTMNLLLPADRHPYPYSYADIVAMERKSIIYSSYDHKDHVVRIFPNGHGFDVSLTTGLITPRNRYELLPISEQGSILKIYSKVDDKLFAIVFSRRMT